ncbi:MAG: NAD(P)/FAD-dependent oxidoreductase [Clostridia bacterium]|nr:NAD(P)/FAD-dependent oxidoreductase [Clostridia bacterium]
MTKIAIIGGGASGLFAAIIALENGSDVNVTIFERLNRVGKKILATGNGRCNITNEFACETDENGKLKYFHGKNSDFAKFSFSKFNTKDLIDYFSKNGLTFRKENDKYFPFSEQAGTILDFLRLKCEMLGVNFVTDTEIKEIISKNEKFIVNNQSFDKVIIASGGKSSPHLGSNGSGYALLEKFGHKTTKLFPAITQIKTETEYVKQLKGIKADANCSIFIKNELKRQEFGQVLFAEYGLSGPPIFQLSRIAATNYDKNCYITLDFMTDKSEKEVFNLIKTIIEKPFTYPLTTENLLSLILNKRLGQIIIKYCGFKLNTDVYSLKDSDLMKIASAIKCFKLKVTGVNGFQNAQVTAGGIETKDFNDKTLESKLKNGLFACGEVLDIDGDCGGFNLQWAFSSGFIAGNSAAGNLL